MGFPQPAKGKEVSRDKEAEDTNPIPLLDQSPRPRIVSTSRDLSCGVVFGGFLVTRHKQFVPSLAPATPAIPISLRHPQTPNMQQMSLDKFSLRPAVQPCGPRFQRDLHAGSTPSGNRLPPSLALSRVPPHQGTRGRRGHALRACPRRPSVLGGTSGDSSDQSLRNGAGFESLPV